MASTGLESFRWMELTYHSKLIYNESSKTLYQQADFHFNSHSGHEGMGSDADEVFHQHLAFLRTVSELSLQFIRSLTIQHDTMLGSIAAKRKRETEEGGEVSCACED
jgi:hypothetical protein